MRSKFTADEALDNFFPEASIQRKSEPCLEDSEEIIAWISQHLAFTQASITGQLDEWITRYKSSKDCKITDGHLLIFETFSKELKHLLEGELTTDVRNHSPSEISCPTACFIDSIVGLNLNEGRDPDLGDLRNFELLRNFLKSNSHITEHLGLELLKIQPITLQWERCHPVNRTELKPTDSLTKFFSNKKKVVTEPSQAIKRKTESLTDENQSPNKKFKDSTSFEFKA